MKNVFNNTKKVFLMVALLVTVMGYASDRSYYISKGDANRTVLTLVDVKSGNIFTIKDENGIILYKEKIKQDGVYNKGFDLTALPNGNYFFEIEKDMEVTTIPFKVEANIVTFDKELSETIFKPLTIVKKNYVLVSQLSLDKKPLEIEIYYDGDNYNATYQLLYSETISNTRNIERVYKLANYTEGKYKIVYKTEDKQFIEFI